MSLLSGPPLPSQTLRIASFPAWDTILHTHPFPALGGWGLPGGTVFCVLLES